MHFRRILSLATALLLTFSLPRAVLADEYNLDEGSVTITANESGQMVKHGDKEAVSDATPTIKGGTGKETITVSATGENKANLTIENVNAKTIDVGSSNATITVSGSNTVNNTDDAGIHVSSGDLTITGDGTLNVNAQGKLNQSAGIGSNHSEKMSGNITIKDNAQVNATSQDGAGIGSGSVGNMSGIITIEDNANVTATSQDGGAGIGSGATAGMTGEITIGGTSQVKAEASAEYSSGAGIGSGKYSGMYGTISISTGATVDASSIGAGSAGTMSGTIQYFDPDPEPTQPEPTQPEPTQPEPSKTPLYRVLNERGEPLSCTKELADGVLTITVDADFAKLIGTVLSLKTLENQGVTTITLVTKSATSTFSLADLQAKGTGTYTLTHNGETVTFTLAKTDVSDILK